MTEKSAIDLVAQEGMLLAEHGSPRRVPLNMTRKTIARRMEQSAREIPQFSVSIELNADELATGRSRINATLASDEERVSVTALLIWLTAQALRTHPLLNARFDQDAILEQDAVNIAVAMDTPDGLKAPVVRQAQTLSVYETARALKDLTSRAASKRLALNDFKDATFTISNLGMFGVSRFIPLVNPPQAAILGVGGPRKTVQCDADGKSFARQTIELTVAADHRILDGVSVARFLRTLQESVHNVGVGKELSEGAAT